jgi:hypothetical protein
LKRCIPDLKSRIADLGKSFIADLGKSAKIVVTAKVLVQSKNLLKQKDGLRPCLEDAKVK